MKFIWQYIIIFIWTACLLASCSETEIDLQEKPTEEEVQNEAAVHFSLIASNAVTTRAVNEEAITSIDVIFFRRSGTVGSYEYTFDGGEYDLKFEEVGSYYKTSFLPPYYDDGLVWNVMIMTNATEIIQGLKGSWTGMSMADVQKTLIYSLDKEPTTDPKTYWTPKEFFLIDEPTTPEADRKPTGFPMYALLEDRELNDRKAKQLGNISVIRMVAKFTINNSLEVSEKDKMKKKIYIYKAYLVNDFKTSYAYTDYYTLNSSQNPGRPTIPETWVDPTKPNYPTFLDKVDRELVFSDVDDKDETDPKVIGQTITFYAFESRNSTEEAGSGKEVIYIDNKFVRDCNDPAERNYTHIRLETFYDINPHDNPDFDPDDPSNERVTYFIPIPKVAWNMISFTIFTDRLGDILRNYHYILNIKGGSRTQLIDTYVEVQDWNNRNIPVHDLE